MILRAIADEGQDRKTRRHEHGIRSTSPRLKQSKHPVESTDSTRTSTLPIPTRPAAKHLPNLQTTEVSSNNQYDGASKDANVECATAAWTKAFQDAMYKLSLLGLPEDKKPGLMDCTAILG
jgi:hypothetical protein